MPRDQTSVESSTRATTLSPGPQSNATGFTSPAPSGADCEVPKSQGVGPDGPFCYTPLADMSRRPQGLTEDHPTLTTFFEGEIIGSKYSFETQHDEWGASSKTDLSHWAKFSAFRPLQKHVHKGRVTILDIDQRDNIFMRWKEHFLVPDHRVRTITGASFEGFYYICFNQLKDSNN
ncbi:hypothetical protein RJ55_07927 [Drechmeria coniospora]|nr:hypothetical protein RJ55_07927 [Drechmeria coniospora]